MAVEFTGWTHRMLLYLHRKVQGLKVEVSAICNQQQPLKKEGLLLGSEVFAVLDRDNSIQQQDLSCFD